MVPIFIKVASGAALSFEEQPESATAESAATEANPIKLRRDIVPLLVTSMTFFMKHISLH